MTLINFFLGLSIFLFVLSTRSDRIKQKCIGLIPKTLTEKVIVFVLDNSLQGSILTGLICTVLTMLE